MIGGYLAQTSLHFNTGFGHLLLDRFSIPFFTIGFLGIVALVVVKLWLKKTKKQYANNQEKKQKIIGILTNPVF